MFENVFGYKSTIVGKSKEEEVKSSVRAMTNQQPQAQYLPGIELNNLVGMTMAESKTNLPEVILDQTPVHMRASADQESARVIMETRVIQNLIYSYFNIVKKNMAKHEWVKAADKIKKDLDQPLESLNSWCVKLSNIAEASM